MNDWERFFDAYASKYDGEIYTQHTDVEIPFLIEQLRPPTGGHILDLGCGTGRHGVALAQRGFRVTGVDLSGGMLAIAQERAKAASVSVEWVQANAVAFVRPEAFDAAICLCEGAMCLHGADDDPLERDTSLLRNICSSLKPGGRLVLNVLNGCRQIRAFNDDDVAAGRFDPLTMTEASDVRALLGHTDPLLQLRERGYTPPEIRRMAAWAGLWVDGVYGGTAGAWNLQKPQLDEIELMILAQRPTTAPERGARS